MRMILVSSKSLWRHAVLLRGSIFPLDGSSSTGLAWVETWSAHQCCKLQCIATKLLVVTDVVTSRQMRGRAGRKGKDEIGETYLCCQKTDLEAVSELMTADIPQVESCLTPEKRGIER